ncbi:hypothetical protein NP493_702g01003 [Ridgeia piscesae]|uniref:Vacuolar protein sorting-associated protein 13 n=1 Tax=Ridgeia piscesae TaxID=27915 RepID=A0AAD9KQW8_RIDPI|nr:hypothetical protein NP493_702g01003 [Ridgeia piscesae]
MLRGDRRYAGTASLKIGESDWSDKFSLDTVGSSGTVTCKVDGNRKKEVGINISLSSAGLTKIVTITPYYLLFNHTEFELACKEVTTDVKTTIPWVTIGAGQCLPFWPIQSSQNAQMVVKVSGTDKECMPFSFAEPINTLLQLHNEYGGLGVECIINETAIQVTFSQYSSGLATVQLVNHTSMATISYSQIDNKGKTCQLEPGKTILYTWDDPLKKRELVWSCGNEKNHKDELVEDGNGDLFYTSDSKLYWVSFLNGMQRVLFFTEDVALAIIAQQAGELEQIDQEINLSPARPRSGVIWEEKKRKRFRALKLKQSVILEKAYELYQASLAADKHVKSRVHLEGKMEVDFGEEQMMMYKPNKCSIRRSFEDGIWLQYRVSPHQLQLHTKIHRLQIDDQLPGAMFPVVFAPIPPPKSVAADSVPKPFTELSVMIRTRDYTDVKQFKYCKLLIQEMELKVDQGFINAMMAMFASSELTDEDERNQFNGDVENTRKALEDDMQQTTANEQKHFYDMLHFSPLKIHLSFSMYGTSGDADQPKRLRQNVMDVFLQSVGIVLTDIQDVVFKLGYFERNHAFYNQTEMSGHITRHYIQQAIKQMYVLVLGLDVLGNPFGVIRGLATGIETLFYEPYQGAVQGPEEFAEGLALGVRSLLGHAVGGAAGAVSRITGALGKGIATLTLDDDYQKKRRENMTKRPTDVKEGLARGGKGLVMVSVWHVEAKVLLCLVIVSVWHVEAILSGGAAGAVSRITGALGKGIATLTLDDDYQKKRRENMTKRPTDVKEGLARGGKGLVMVSVWHVEAKVLSWSCHGECLARGGKGLVMVSVWHVEAKVLSWSCHGECLARGGKGLVMVSVWQWRQRSCHGECLACGGKGLVTGVVDGVTGIVRKPVEGAKKEGVEGFFKGVGKGLVGVITRPASGVVDFASISFDGIRRAADVATEVRRQRPPRLLQADGVIKPYFFREADGMEILRFVDKGKFAETDTYMAHVYVTNNHSNVLLVTDKRVMFTSKGDIFGQWDVDWRYIWDELKEVPTVGPRGVQLLLKKKEKKLFKSSTMGKSIPLPDQAVAKWVVAKMKEAMEQAKYTGNEA